MGFMEAFQTLILKGLNKASKQQHAWDCSLWSAPLAVTPPGVIAIVTLCHDGDYEISPPTPGVPDTAQLTAVGLSGDNSIQLSSNKPMCDIV